MAFVLSASASIRRILTSGNRKSSGTRFRCCPIPMKGHSPLRCLASRGRTERRGHSAPSRISFDSNGIVRWANLTENIAVRARPEQVLEALNQLGPAGQ